jgi:hypothetical protein
MKQLQETTFDDFTEDKQIIWEIYGELLDFYDDQTFSAKQLSYELGHSKKLINKVLHRLIQTKALKCLGMDTWGDKRYQLVEEFTSL